MVLKYKNNSINKISSRKFTSPGEHHLTKSTFSTIMPNTRRHSNDLNFKLRIVIEAEAVNNNREIAFADLMNVTEKDTIHRPNLSTILSSAFIRGDLDAVTRGPFI